jgi:hypothetical protein
MRHFHTAKCADEESGAFSPHISGSSIFAKKCSTKKSQGFLTITTQLAPNQKGARISKFLSILTRAQFTLVLRKDDARAIRDKTETGGNFANTLCYEVNATTVFNGNNYYHLSPLIRAHV